MNRLEQIQNAVQKGREALLALDFVYPRSVREIKGEFIFLARLEKSKHLFTGPAGALSREFEGETRALLRVCPLSPGNAASLRRLFPFTSPAAIGNRPSFGTGDRMGLATPGHVRAFMKYDIFPVLAQQSMREMTRTHRTAQEVLDDATFGVFQEGYEGGFGADADHIKTAEDALMCLSTGFTMFTVDAADHINKKGNSLPDNEAVKLLNESPDNAALRAAYLDKKIRFEENGRAVEIEYTEASLGKALAVYGRAVRHMADVYAALRKASKGRAFDFEVSIDETDAVTLPRDHFFVANELKRLKVDFQSLAPKFVGQFQKGIDYIGDPREFERQFSEHAIIARRLGDYKLSIHSGSDKFTVFPVIGKYSQGHFHGKTAGTSWLEAVRVVAVKAPVLYRQMHKFALTKFEKDRQSYHVTTDIDGIPDVDAMQDAELPMLLDMVDSRQLMHITYGSILSTKNIIGHLFFREEMNRILFENEELHYQFLSKHIERHLETLGVKKKEG